MAPKQKQSDFDKQKLYELLSEIPRGRVTTYGDLAEMLGNKSWAQAVGNALHENPDGDKYPCYKVVTAKGELSRAYAFGGIDEQKRRLESDGITVENWRVDLKKYRFDTDKSSHGKTYLNTEKPSILITGAYGGMGKATAKALSRAGFRIFALDKTVGAADQDIIPIEADITDENSVRAAFQKIGKVTDTLFAVIHFAGIYMLDSLVEIDKADFEKIFKINLGGVFLVNKIFLPILKEDSRIVITTSELAPLDPLPFTGIYAVTKSALDKYAYSLRMELQLKEIKVSVLRAGAVNTGMLAVSTAALEHFHQKTELYICNAERFSNIVAKVEARNIKPEAIAKKVMLILQKRTPKFSYNINRNPFLLMLNILPRRLQFWTIKKVLETKKQ